MAADFEEIQERLEGFMKRLSDPKGKEKYKVLEQLRDFLFEPRDTPYLNLDQIDYVLVGDEDEKVLGLCHLCQGKSSFLKTIKRSGANALQLIHSLLFKRDYFLREQVQDEFRGQEASAYTAMDLGSHFKELAKSVKKGGNFALDILVFLRVSVGRPSVTVLLCS
jgi:hypothetical protein